MNNNDIESKTGTITGLTDRPGDITFAVNGGIEIVRLCGNGDIKVKGKLIENDKELVDGLREFLKLGKIEQNVSWRRPLVWLRRHWF